MIGGESPGIGSHWLDPKAHWIEWAQEHNAALFVLEHRYYGQSHPRSNLTIENMRWLSSR